MKQALLVVDVQNDFLPGGALSVPDGDAIIPLVLELMREETAYDLIVASQDWHPHDHGSFASVQSGVEPFQTGELAGLPQVFWPDHCVQTSGGARLEKQIRETLADAARQGHATLIVKKGQDQEVDSYSAFFDNARRHDTGLDRALKAHDITAVDIVGLAFDYCVKATAQHAASLGYTTRILMQGTRAIDPDMTAQHIAELQDSGVQCIGADS